jgi:hypothetical protein
MLYMFQALSPPIMGSKTVETTAIASMGELFKLTHASGNSKQAWHIPDVVCTVFELLMMGGETA